jgi:hypothetical protein
VGISRGVGPRRSSGDVTASRHAACGVRALGLWWLGKVERGQGRRRAGEFRLGPARRQLPSLSCSRPRPPRRLLYLG